MMARYVVSLLVCWLACDRTVGQVCFNPPCGPSATPTPSRQPGAPSGGCGSGLTCQTYVACAVHVVDSTGLQTCSLGTGNSGMCCPPAELDPPTESRPTEIGGDDLIQNRIRETEIRTFNQNELNTAASEAELTLRTLQEKDR
ncbi:unnamed protein product [Cyprideis torosa]|uniref:Uncharacterized protein n=1 Tax=Cyprideis torosa TaxID=163714 RepID=A0A7R8WCV5_9CRUS|nr:unnamed protein product [Cyprideis torosa]CAG0888340.1 unnamed protein product [Cyprideis torosa]